jgi:DNA-binding FrmR family transcriptional regulator
MATPGKGHGSLTSEPELKKKLLNRVRTVIGHAQGIEKMIAEDRYCIDILKQIAAVQASLSKVAHGISESHMKHCVAAAVEHGQGEEKIEELMETLKYLKHF